MYTDKDAVELLDALLKYFSVTLADEGGFDPLDPSQLRVSELASDLLSSLGETPRTDYSVLKP